MNFIDCFNKTEVEKGTITKKQKEETEKIKEFVERYMVGVKYDRMVNSYSTVRHILKLNDVMAANKYNGNLFIKPLEAMLDKSEGTVSMTVSGANVYIDIKKTREEKGILTFSYGISQLNKKEKEDDTLDFYIGEKVDGGAQILSFSQSYPHMLIGGVTGSGKSISVSNIVLSLLMRYTEKELNIYTIDPKNETFVGYEKACPDIFKGSATDINGTMKLLSKVDNILRDRLENVFPTYEAWGIDDYNDMVSGKDKLPYIMLIIEETDSLFNVSKNNTSSTGIRAKVTELAKKYRSAGLRLIMISQQPNAKNMTTELRDQCSMRIALHMEPIGSRMVLNNKLAATLQNGGDCYVKSEEDGLNRVQTALITKQELKRAQKWLKEHRNRNFVFKMRDSYAKSNT